MARPARWRCWHSSAEWPFWEYVRRSPTGREEPVVLAGRSHSARRAAHRCGVAPAEGVAVGRLADEEWQLPAVAVIETQ